MPESSDIDAALVAKLGADAALLALMPNGVYMDVAQPRMTRFVIVSVLDALDELAFGQRSHEEKLYLVKAVGLSTTNPNMRDAAARIDAVLEGGTLTVAGYSLMAIRRERAWRQTEVDDVDPTVRWYHRGGHYRVVMST